MTPANSAEPDSWTTRSDCARMRRRRQQLRAAWFRSYPYCLSSAGFMPTTAILASAASASISSRSSSSVRPASTASAVVPVFDHRSYRARTGHRHVKEQMRARPDAFTNLSDARHQRRGTAQHGIGPLHRLQSHAGALGDGHALAEIESG